MGGTVNDLIEKIEDSILVQHVSMCVYVMSSSISRLYLCVYWIKCLIFRLFASFDANSHTDVTVATHCSRSLCLAIIKTSIFDKQTSNKLETVKIESHKSFLLSITYTHTTTHNIGSGKKRLCGIFMVSPQSEINKQQTTRTTATTTTAPSSNLAIAFCTDFANK